MKDVFIRDWKERKRAKPDWVGRVLELLCVFFLVILLSIQL